ncbi:MAG: serine/threonine-protein kinase [Kofleriaceae bacterium]
MPQFWCPSCHQFYSETGYCPFDGARLSIPPDAVSHPVVAVSAHNDALDAADLVQQAADHAAVYDRLVGVTLDGRYQIERKIGEGGMGVVFAARHLVIERPLAIKVLKREVARDASTIKRFVQEARAASRIGHPNIVDVTDFGTTPDGMTYSVMEYVDGKTLSAAIKLGAPMPADRALPIAAQIAQALQAAHDKGIVHRDLKPENVFLINRDGRRDFVKIVDFGIAKVTPLDQSGALAPGKADGPRLTRAGAVFGTPEYMAPEQAAGRSDNDGRVDVYALGTILYEMLTGRVPHKSDSMVRTLAMQMLDPIEPPSKVAPDQAIDPAVEAVVMKALAKKRDERYPTMAAFLGALAEAVPAMELAQPVSTSVTARSLAGGVLQPLPPGMASSPDATTMRPLKQSTPPPSKPPPPLAPVTATGDVPRYSTGKRSLHEPAFVTTATQEPRITLDLIDEPPPEPAPAARWPWALAAIVVMGGAGVGAAIMLKRRAPASVAERDAGVPTDARTVIEYDLDGGPEPVTDAGRPPGPGPGPRSLRDAGALPTIDAGGDRPRDAGPMGRTPAARGNVQIEVLTRPDGGILFQGTSYRGPAGVHIEERKGTKLRLRCTLPGYQPGFVDLVFDGETELAVCTMKRLPCVPGLKDPFQDCPE